MKDIIPKKEPNLSEKVKAVKETGSVVKSAIENNSKEAKEFYETLKKILDTKSNISNDFRQYAVAEMEGYKKALDTATSNEERKEIYKNMKMLHENVMKITEECLSNIDTIEKDAKEETEKNRLLNWKILVGFGSFAVISIGALVFNKGNGHDITDTTKKLISRK